MTADIQSFPLGLFSIKMRPFSNVKAVLLLTIIISIIYVYSIHKHDGILMGKKNLPCRRNFRTDNTIIGRKSLNHSVSIIGCLQPLKFTFFVLYIVWLTTLADTIDELHILLVRRKKPPYI